ncbi:DUF3280 domain-containing protein [Consotaella aegiceratis]|uniref:DUF3280 domain-containing protein n=1 Tax=Consotaella aegiceratis TaxID=3097961 RepID=UPI002F3EF396
MFDLLDRRHLLGLGFLLLVGAATGRAAEPVSVAVFDFELIDTSQGGVSTVPPEAEAHRLRLLSEQLRHAYEAAADYRLVDIAPVADEAKARNRQGCGECDRTFAQELGADWSVTGTVWKVSNLVLNIRVYVRDVASGEIKQTLNADIRGNTDQSWQRGLDWLIRNRLKLK